MNKQKYNRPPIIESVIEIRYAEPINDKLIEKAPAKFKDDYPAFNKFDAAMGVHIDVNTKKTEFIPESIGYKFASTDQVDVLVLNSQSFIVSRLAPYCGWEDFKGRGERDWKIWNKIIKNPDIKRIGVRYVNRIDIPQKKGEEILIEDYLLCYPSVPVNKFPKISRYAMQLISSLEDDFQLMINTATVPSPLLNHYSIIFDFDVSKENNLPRKEEELWALVEKIRNHRNNVFENAITDKARELFK